MPVTYFRRFRMQFDLRRELFEKPPLPAGFVLVPWSENLASQHSEAKYRSFENELDANIFPSLGDSWGCQRLVKDISGRSGFVPGATWLVQDCRQTRKRPRPCGTIQGMVTQAEVGAIQNIGIVPEARNLGLGTILIREALNGMRLHGLKFATLEVTANNVAAVRLYQRLGFQQSKVVYKSVEIRIAT